MQYNNNNNNPCNPYNPYNPYLCNSQHTPNVATAPPLDEVNYLDQLPPNHMYIQQPYPVVYPYPYPDSYPNSPFMTPVEQYNREIQMQMRKKQQEDDCCCFGLLTILCCCCIY